jgi:predicted metal-dependent hydrolase
VADRGSIAFEDSTIDYVIVRSRLRRRTLALSVDEDGNVKVAVPMTATSREIHDFVARHARWVIERRAVLAALPARPALVAGATLLHLGAAVQLAVARVPGTRWRVALDGQTLRVGIPGQRGEDAAQRGIAVALERWYRGQAASRLVADTQRWSSIMDVTPRDVRVRDQKRRWGSCGADGTIRFNWRLVMAPTDIIDYMVVHELAHLRVLNHSPAFWAEVARFMPDYAERRARLNRLGRTLPL